MSKEVVTLSDFQSASSILEYVVRARRSQDSRSYVSVQSSADPWNIDDSDRLRLRDSSVTSDVCSHLIPRSARQDVASSARVTPLTETIDARWNFIIAASSTSTRPYSSWRPSGSGGPAIARSGTYTTVKAFRGSYANGNEQVTIYYSRTPCLQKVVTLEGAMGACPCRWSSEGEAHLNCRIPL
jgi:hypothetical protein